MCLCEDKIAQLECKIAKLQRRVCELECNRRIITQPIYTPVWYDTTITCGTTADNRIAVNGSSGEYKC